jgi:hypothetical protein
VAEGLGVPLVYMGLARPPPLWEHIEPDPAPGLGEARCAVLRFAVSQFLDRDGRPDVPWAPATRCGTSPCAARLLAALAAGFLPQNHDATGDGLQPSRDEDHAHAGTSCLVSPQTTTDRGSM